MKKAEIIKYLKRNYRAQKDGSDWKFVLKDDAEGELAVWVSLGGTSKQQALRGMPLLNLPWHKQQDLKLFQDKDGFVRPFFVGKEQSYYSESGILEEKHIDMMIDHCFEWFKQQIQPEPVALDMKKHYEQITGFPPAGWQPKHIMACMLKGDVEKLQTYLDAFKRGDRMDFIPIIQQEYFERAIPLAEKYRSGELVSPVQF